MFFFLVLNPIENVNTQLFSETVSPKGILKPIQDVFGHFMKKLQEAKELL